jgi:hypothetical protein
MLKPTLYAHPAKTRAYDARYDFPVLPLYALFALAFRSTSLVL